MKDTLKILIPIILTNLSMSIKYIPLFLVNQHDDQDRHYFKQKSKRKLNKK